MIGDAHPWFDVGVAHTHYHLLVLSSGKGLESGGAFEEVNLKLSDCCVHAYSLRPIGPELKCFFACPLADSCQNVRHGRRNALR